MSPERSVKDLFGPYIQDIVGANGFEPSTSWSPTKSLNPINALSGVAYGTRDLISPLLVVSEGTRSNAECCRAKCDSDNPWASPSPLRRDRTDEKECERDEDRMTHQPDDPIPLGIGSGKGFANQPRCCDQAQAIHAGSDCEVKKSRIAWPWPQREQHRAHRSSEKDEHA